MSKNNSRVSSTTTFDSPSGSSTEFSQNNDLQNSLKEQGNAFYQNKKFADAIRLYSEAIDLDPLAESAAAIYSNRALCYQSIGAFLDAFADGSAAAAIRPDWPRGFERRATAAESIASKPPAEDAAAFISAYQFPSS